MVHSPWPLAYSRFYTHRQQPCIIAFVHSSVVQIVPEQAMDYGPLTMDHILFVKSKFSCRFDCKIFPMGMARRLQQYRMNLRYHII